MNQVYTLYSVFFLATALVSFFVAILAWRRKFVKGAAELTMLMVASGIWAFWIIFETAAVTMPDKLFWAKLEYFGAVSTPVLYLVFVLRFTGKDKYLSVKHILFLFTIPLITLLFAITNEKHLLVWSGFSAISETTNLMEYYHGPWFWFGYMGYNYVILLLATILLFNFIIHQKNTFRSQGWVILFASIFPWTASIVYLTNFNPVPGLDITPVSIILTGILLVYAILYVRFLDLVPVAREILVETLPDGILALDAQNRVQDINQAAISFLGIRNKKILGFSVEYSGVSGTQLYNAVIDQAFVGQIEIQAGHTIKTFKIFKQPIKNQQGSRLIVIRDISEQIAGQKEIFDAEQRYRKISSMFRLMADNMPDLLWAKNLDKKFIFVNKAVCEKLIQAKDIEEPIGKNDLFFAERQRQEHPEQPDWYTFGELCQDSDKATIKSGKPEHFDEFGNVKGKFLFLDVQKAPIFDENGVMVGVVGSARDVTIQKKTETEIYNRDVLLDAIAKATAMLVEGENLLEGIKNALEIIGKATEANRVYIFKNHDEPGYKMPMMSQILEWTDGSIAPEIDFQKLQNLPYENDFPRWFTELSSGKVIVGNVREFPESEKHILQVQDIKSMLVTPVIIDKIFWGFIGFDECHRERDWTLTEELLLSAAANTIGAAYLRKKNQEELIIAKEHAEESDRLKSAFLISISHEIRTPMSGILEFVGLLKEQGLTNEERSGYIRIIEKNGARILDTFNDIVEISKLVSGQIQVSISETNINEQIEFVYYSLKHDVESKGLAFSFKNSLAKKEAIIHSDHEKINAILVNLVKNAIKFSMQGSIEFGYDLVETLDPTSPQYHSFLEFYVKDTGIGIPKDKQEAIFERFYRVDIEDKQAFQGAGIGLSIAKAYVEMLGGKIWVDSEEGKGSIFYFTVPSIYKPQ